MSVRPPTRSPVPAPAGPARQGSLADGEPSDLEDLEELGDDAIISQETAAHAPKPRVNVAEESRSIVITEPPVRRTEPPRRSSHEATLVIRDRRALDELRQNIVRRQARKVRRRSLYLWGGLGLLAFLLGGLVAFLFTDDAPSASDAGASPSASAVAPSSISAPAKPRVAPIEVKAVRLDDLPVEPPAKR